MDSACSPLLQNPPLLRSSRLQLQSRRQVLEQVGALCSLTPVHAIALGLRPPVTNSMQPVTEPRGMQRCCAPRRVLLGRAPPLRQGAALLSASGARSSSHGPILRGTVRVHLEPAHPGSGSAPGASSEIEIVNRASAAVAEACEQQVGLVKEALAAACQAELGQLRVFLGEACTAETEKLRLAVTQATNAELQRVSAVLAKAVTQEVETVRSSCMAEVGRVKEALRSACELEVIAVKERCQSEVTQVKAALQQACALEVALVKEACQQEVRCCAPAQSPWPE